MSKEEIEKLLENVKSKSEIAKRFNYKYFNGRVGKDIETKLQEVGLTIESVLPKKEIKCCQCCREPLKRGQNKFCSHSCSAKVTNVGKIKSECTKQKISLKNKGRKLTIKNPVINKCLCCGEIFVKTRHNKKYCSETCRNTYVIDVEVECSYCSKKFISKKNNRNGLRTTCSKECATKKTLDRSYQNGSRKTIKYFNKWYGEVVLESTWEEKVAMELDDNNIKWKRPEPLKWIDSNGKSHLYYSDFYLEDYDVYLDPKNPYCMKLDKEKMSIVTKDVNVIYGDLEIVINYIKEL